VNPQGPSYYSISPKDAASVSNELDELQKENKRLSESSDSNDSPYGVIRSMEGIAKRILEG